MLKKQKVAVLLLFLSLVGVVAGAATGFIPVTTVQVARLGTFTTTTQAFDSTTGGAVGCQVRLYVAGDTVRIGHVVYLSAQNAIQESATLANYNSLVGVVVGGTRTSMQASYVVGDTSTIAAITGQFAWVCYSGRTWVVVDTVTGGISPGAQIIPSLVKGRVKARGSAIDSQFRVFGKMVDTGVRNTAALANIIVR